MSTEPQDELVTVQARVGWAHRQRQDAWLGGRLLARRVVWDRPPMLGEGVRLVSGVWPLCAGSVDQPQLGFQSPVVLELAGMRRADLVDLGPWEGDLEVVEDREARREALTTDLLLRERARLLAQVAEIDEILTESGHEPDQEMEET